MLDRTKHYNLLKDLNTFKDYLAQNKDVLRQIVKYLEHLQGVINGEEEWDTPILELHNKAKNGTLTYDEAKYLVDTLNIENTFVNVSQDVCTLSFYAKCWSYDLTRSIYMELLGNKLILDQKQVINLPSEVKVSGYSQKIKLDTTIYSTQEQMEELSDEEFRSICEW